MWHIDTTVIRLLDGDPRLPARGDRPILAPIPCRVNDENPREKVQSVRADSSAHNTDVLSAIPCSVAAAASLP